MSYYPKICIYVHMCSTATMGNTLKMYTHCREFNQLLTKESWLKILALSALLLSIYHITYALKMKILKKFAPFYLHVAKLSCKYATTHILMSAQSMQPTKRKTKDIQPPRNTGTQKHTFDTA